MELHGVRYCSSGISSFQKSARVERHSKGDRV